MLDSASYVPLRRLAPYRDAEWVVKSKQRKRGLQTLRSEIEQSIKGKRSTKRKEKRKRAESDANEDAGEADQSNTGETVAAEVDEPTREVAQPEPVAKRKKKKRRHKKAATTDDNAPAQPDAAADGQDTAAGAEKVSAAKARRLRKARRKAAAAAAASGQAQTDAGSGGGAAPAASSESVGDASSTQDKVAVKHDKKDKKSKKDKKDKKDKKERVDSRTGLTKSRLSSYQMPTLQKASGLATKGKKRRMADAAAGQSRRTPLA